MECHMNHYDSHIRLRLAIWWLYHRQSTQAPSIPTSPATTFHQSHNTFDHVTIKKKSMMLENHWKNNFKHENNVEQNSKIQNEKHAIDLVSFGCKHENNDW